MNRKWKIVLSCLLFSSMAWGQESPTNNTERSFSLTDAVAYAQAHAYEIISSGYELRQAKKKIWETIAIGLPQLNAEANYNDNLELQTSLLPAEIMGGKKGEYIPVKFGQQYTADVSITATQLIFDGTYIVGLKASKVYYQLSENKMEKVKEAIREGVSQAYFYVLAAEENYATLQESLVNSEKIEKEAKAYYEEGLREDTDADQAALSVSTIAAKVNEAKRGITAARTTLKYLMGIDVNSSIVLKSKLEELVATTLLQSNEQPVLDWKKHIDYRILETQKQAQELLVKKEIAAYLPTFSAFYRYGKNTSTNDWNVFDKNTEWFSSSILGFKLSLPLFSSGMRYSKVKQARLELDRVENQITQKLQEMQQNKLLAENNLATSKANYITSEKSKKLAKKIYDKTKLKYTEGVSNSFELAQNEQQYLQTHANYIGALLELLKANIAYKKALGEL